MSHASFHPPTFLVATAVFCVLASGVTWSLSRTFRSRVHGLGAWTSAMLLTAIALIGDVGSLRGGSAVAILTSAASTVAAAMCARVAIERFFGREPDYRSLRNRLALAFLAILVGFAVTPRGPLPTLVARYTAIASLGSAVFAVTSDARWRRSLFGGLTAGGLVVTVFVLLASTIPGVRQPLQASPAWTERLEHWAVLLVLLALSLASSTLGFILLVNERVIANVADLAIRDELSGLLTRRAFFDFARTEVHRARREGRAIAVAMIDIDHFKKINDTYGHLAGDQAIRHTAGLIRDTLRGSDLVGRYGGEEFCALLGGVDHAGVALVVERLMQRVRETFVEYKKVRIPIRVSIGVHVVSGAYEPDIEQLLASSDRLLYEAKRNGRDRAVVGPSEEGSVRVAP